MLFNKARPKSFSVSNSFQKSLRQANANTKNRIQTQSSNEKRSQRHYMKGDHAKREQQNRLFTQTAQQLTGNNFSHHQDDNCCCKSCQCGRHLCKFNVIKPAFTKKTVYKRSYYKKKPIKNVVNHDKEYDRLQGPHLDIKSTYSEGFKPVKGDNLSRPHPEDLLHMNGPCQQVTSYSNQFPGFKGDNQYIKPTDKHAIAYFPLRSNTTYEKNYVKKDIKKDDYTYIPDQLRTSSNWFGKTTYGQFYNKPNSSYFPKKVKIVERLQTNPNYSRQYQTVYKNDFIEKANPLCPAKIFLQTKGQGIFNQQKGTFTENSDFKAMSPQYHAISNSKHYYV